MDPFSYLSVLISIILGLALAQLISGAGRLIQYRARVDFYWPTLVWIGVFLVIDIQSWWAMFNLRGVREWTFPGFLVVLMHPLSLYLVSALVAPDAPDFFGERRVDLRANYFAHHRWFFGAILAAIAASLARPLVLYGNLAGVADVAVQCLWFALCLGAIASRNETYHRVLAGLFPLMLAVYIGALFVRL